MARTSLKEVSVVDKIEILLNNSIQVRRRDQILKNGEEVAATYHRHVIHPGDDLSNEDPKVVAVASALWTEEVIAAYKASLPVTE